MCTAYKHILTMQARRGLATAVPEKNKGLLVEDVQAFLAQSLKNDVNGPPPGEFNFARSLLTSRVFSGARALFAQ